MVAERHRIAPHRDREPDKTVAFVAEMDFEAPEGAVVFSCPMHPEVVSLEEGKCPQCGMKLMPTAAAVVYTCPMHPDVVSATEGKCPECGMKLMPTAGVAYTLPDAPRGRQRRAGQVPRVRHEAHAGVGRLGATGAHGHEHASGHGGTTHDHGDHATHGTATTTPPAAGSSGRTTWSRSTGPRRRRTRAGS